MFIKFSVHKRAVETKKHHCILVLAAWEKFRFCKALNSNLGMEVSLIIQIQRQTINPKLEALKKHKPDVSAITCLQIYPHNTHWNGLGQTFYVFWVGGVVGKDLPCTRSLKTDREPVPGYYWQQKVNDIVWRKQQIVQKAATHK